MALIKGYKKMKLSQQQENLLKYVPSVEVRAKIRSYMKSLIKDIERTYKLTNTLGWKWRMERDRRKARKELKWKPKTNFKDLVKEMVSKDIERLS